MKEQISSLDEVNQESENIQNIDMEVGGSINLPIDNSFSINQLLKDAGKQSLKAVKWFALISVIFGFLNLLFFIISISRYFYSEGSQTSLLFFILSVVLAIGFTVLSFYMTYKFLLIDTLHVVYKYLTPFFKRLSISIIDKLTSKTLDLSSKNKNISKTFDIGNILFEVYGRKVPRFIQKAVLFGIKQIPFSDFVFNMKDDLNNKDDNKRLSEILYQQIDSYIQQKIFVSNNMKWISWLLPLNIIVEIVLIILLSNK